MKFFLYKVVIVLFEDVYLIEDVLGFVVVDYYYFVFFWVGIFIFKLWGVIVVVFYCDLWKNVFVVVFFEMYIYNVGVFL